MVTYKNIGLGAVALFSAAAMAQDWAVGSAPEECDLDAFAVNFGSGSFTGGAAFCASKWKRGLLPKAIDTQWDRDSLRGMQVTYSDNSVDTLGAYYFGGAEQSRHERIEWDPATNMFNKLNVWHSGYNGNDNNAVSRIELWNDNTQKLGAGNDWWADFPVEPLATGGGMLLGLRGRHGVGGCIDRIEFIFSATKIKEFELVDMVYTPSVDEVNDRPSNEERGFTIETVDTLWQANITPQTTTGWLEGSKTLSMGTSITKSTTDTFGLSLGFSYKASFGVPSVSSQEIGVNTEFSWSHASTESKTTDTIKGESRGWKHVIPVGTNQAVHCRSITLKSTQEDIQWTGKISVKFEDGNALQYDAKGDYNTVQYSDVFNLCEPVDVQDVFDKVDGADRVIIDKPKGGDAPVDPTDPIYDEKRDETRVGGGAVMRR